MEGYLEPVDKPVKIVRVGPEAKAYGDPYTWAAPACFESPTEVTIKGATRAPTPAEWRAACQTLAKDGVRTLKFTRIRDGREEEHVIELRG